MRQPIKTVAVSAMIAEMVAMVFALTACGGGGSHSGGLVTPPPPDAVSSIVHVVDGDTVDIDGRRWRLAGFDAPERHQSCRDSSDREWACGQAATDELQRLAATGTVSCSDSGQVSHGRTVGSCAVGSQDFGAVLVTAGLAVNDPRYSPSYATEEQEARREGRGVHSGRYLPPWDWRRGERLRDTAPSLLLTDSTDIAISDLLPSDDHVNVIGLTTPNGAPEMLVYGGWIGRSAFSVLAGNGITIGASWAPHFPATNPKELDGAMRWMGLMVGVNTDDSETVTGQASIQLSNFLNPKVDVSFTGIRTSGTAVSTVDLHWEGLPVSSGAFASVAPGHRIQGRFYGDRHQEAGGVFETRTIVGAFGVSRH
ncbi:MAG: thermonuclease family protein [Gemmatimonadota bacterium]|nr:thermonuclease family protein [Gemmatimonadota bacterium]